VLTYRIISVGKNKYRAFDAVISEYQKRLSHYATFEFVSVPNYDENPYTQKIKEAEKIRTVIPQDTFLIVLDLRGKELKSEAFAEILKEASLTHKHFTFIIGGSNGLDQSLFNQANLVISFSKMTFPHELIKVFLVEQLYRAYDINTIRKYHK
jgi:23S rRNA (pseudouridine1915-N3)-methyltransferase